MEKLIENILKLIRIPSISGHDEAIREALELVKKELAPAGAFVREFNFPGASPVLLLSNCRDFDFDIMTVGHLDVVPAEKELFLPRIEDGKIYARGALDMKSQVAVNLAALSYAMDKKIRFGVLLTTDEETTSNGIKALVKNEKINARIVLDTDAGDLLTICDKAKHPVSVRISARGENAHSSRPWEGVNAVEHLMACLEDVKAGFGSYEKGVCRPDDIWQDTMVITAFNSPTTYNVVPAEAEARVNFRLTEKTTLAALEQKLREACARHRCSYEILLSSRGVYMDVSMPEIAAYRRIAEKITGRELKVAQMCGGTDARMFSDRSVIIMHSVNGENAHGDGEYVEIDSVSSLLTIEKEYIDQYIAGKV